MRIHLNKDRTIVIRWEYIKSKALGSKEYNKVKSVACYVENVQGVILDFKTVTLYHKDKFDKEIGRRKSLKKVLASYFPYNDFPNNYLTNYSFRAKIWEAYRTMTKTPRW